LAEEAREHQLAPAAGTDGAVALVEHLRIAIVLVHVREARARVALEPPRGDLREPRQVVRLGAKGRLDLRLGGRDRGAGLARVPRDPDLRLLGEVDALLRR